MKINAIKSILILAILIQLSSCARMIIGMKQIKEVKESTIIQVGNKYGIPTDAIFELDTAYLSFLFSLDTAQYKIEIKNHYQPLQALYYSNNGDLESFQINC